MLFNSAAFIFAFLPLTLLGFFCIGAFHHRAAAGWLTLASLFFYGWWNPIYVPLLLISVVFNYTVGRLIAAVGKRSTTYSSIWLAVGIVGDLGLLAYFKYANFFVDSVDAIGGCHWLIPHIVLPLGISFFTFTQIAFLVDTHRRIATEYNFIHYALFVSYFPHLIAGPILHHRQMMPQFGEAKTYAFSLDDFGVGLTIFIVGLFKKVVLADNMAGSADLVFGAAAKGQMVEAAAAWTGALAYAMQIYFDFSGYSDMAIGLSRMFNIRLPLNFNSPYRALSIVDFWRRWHMTLSAFLRDYLYFPLGGNRKGHTRRYFNLMATMLLGGLWHGAGWTFVIWGGLHGIYLVINHAWRFLAQRWGLDAGHRLYKAAAGTMTFIAVVFAWVYFRAPDLGSADRLAAAMLGLTRAAAHGTGTVPLYSSDTLLICVCLVVAFFAPNTQEFMRAFRPAWDSPDTGGSRLLWQPTWGWACYVGVLGLLAACAELLSQTTVSPFIYYQF